MSWSRITGCKLCKPVVQNASAGLISRAPEDARNCASEWGCFGSELSRLEVVYPFAFACCCMNAWTHLLLRFLLFLCLINALRSSVKKSGPLQTQRLANCILAMMQVPAKASVSKKHPTPMSERGWGSYRCSATTEAPEPHMS